MGLTAGLKKAGHHDVIYPVHIGRGEHCGRDGVAIGVLWQFQTGELHQSECLSLVVGSGAGDFSPCKLQSASGVVGSSVISKFQILTVSFFF